MKPLYRTPQDPGHLGRYSVAPMMSGFLGLLMTNICATNPIQILPLWSTANAILALPWG